MDVQEFFTRNRQMITDNYNQFQAMAVFADLMIKDALSPVQKDILQGFCLSEKEYEEKSGVSLALRFHIMCQLIQSLRPIRLMNQVITENPIASSEQVDIACREQSILKSQEDEFAQDALTYATAAQKFNNIIEDIDQKVQNSRNFVDSAWETAQSSEEILVPSYKDSISFHLAMTGLLLEDMKITLAVCVRRGIGQFEATRIPYTVKKHKYHMGNAGQMTQELKKALGMAPS